MPDSLDKIDTPALLIEQSILEKNIRGMQSMADKHRVNLRPHIKTHKIPQLAHLQINQGAIGIAVAKLGEAEVMNRAGIDDIQVANIITGKKKINRLIKLHQKCRVTVAIDSEENARELANAFARHNRKLDVLIEINSGLNRAGLDSFEEVLNLCRESSKLRGIRIVGLMTHAGHAYAAKNREEIMIIGHNEGKMLVDFQRRLKDKGIKNIKVISVGSTPTAPYSASVRGVTELRAGNYIFHDMTQVSLDVISVKDCALSVLASVVSVPCDSRVVIDAGSKALAMDRGAHGRSAIEGYGYILGDRGTVSRLSEEHGIIDRPKTAIKLGQRLRIIPNHACTATNLFDYAYLVNGNKVIKKLKIAARGKSQ